MPFSQNTDILIVDDSVSDAETLGFLLENAGYGVRKTVDSADAIRWAIRKPPDLILLDIRMPEPDGFEVCRRLKANSLTRDIPVIFLSAHSDASDRIQAFRLGGVDYVNKPYQEPELLARVKTHLRLSKVRHALEHEVDRQTAELSAANELLKREIRERRWTEVSLRRSEKRFRSLIHKAPVGIAITTEAGNVIECNRAFADILGYSVSEIASLNFAEFTHPDDLIREAREIRKVASGQADSYAMEKRLFHRDGRILWVDLVSAVVRDNAGKIDFVFGFVTDITEQKRVEETVRNQNALLEQAVLKKQQEMEDLFEKLLRQEKLAAIGQFTGSLAHELKNPLGAVSQSIYLLRRLAQKGKLTPENPVVSEHLTLMEKEVGTASAVIEGMLDMTRSRPAAPSEISLEEVIEKAYPYCKIPLAIRLETDLSPEPFPVWADRIQIRQLVINLLTNAAQAMGENGEITIRARRVTGKNAVNLEIIDTGPGIAPENLAKVFDPLYTTKPTGTGLGLSVCRQIVDHHHGEIEIISEVGKGTRVLVTLPGPPDP